MYDRLLHKDGPNNTGTRQIPRMIHVSMKSRCLSPDMAYGVQKWKDALPDHSFYFHDDDAVDRLLQSNCPEFPGILDLMKCVRKGAMKIDVWRLLVLHRYGGIYTDIDNWPGARINDSIQKDDTALFVSDAWDRPSQWFMAMEPRHPIVYYSMREALKRVLELKNVHKPRVVFVTGPDALKHGFGAALNWTWNQHTRHLEKLRALGNKAVRKIAKRGSKQVVYQPSDFFNEIVAWNSTENVTRMDRIYRQVNTVHWTKTRTKKRSRNTSKASSCREVLAAEM